MGKQRTDLGHGARNVAWHDALAHFSNLSDEQLDAKYAKFSIDGSERANGYAPGTFWNISQYGFDPNNTYSPRKDQPKQHMSVYKAVSRDPEYAFVNTDVYDPDLWILLSRPKITDEDLQLIITRTLAREGLFRPQKNDRGKGRLFMKDKRPFNFASPDQMDEAIFTISSWETLSSLTLLACFARERLRIGAVEHIRELQEDFNFCLGAVSHKYGFSKRLRILIQWLARFRVFSNRWDNDIPSQENRIKAFKHVNDLRIEQGKKPLRKPDIWVEARALAYHTSHPLHRYAPIQLTPELNWLEENRARVEAAVDDWDHKRETDYLWCPLSSD